MTIFFCWLWEVDFTSFPSLILPLLFSFTSDYGESSPLVVEGLIGLPFAGSPLKVDRRHPRCLRRKPVVAALRRPIGMTT